MADLRNKNILIIGSSRGIGKAISKSLINDNVETITASRSKSSYSNNDYYIDISSDQSINSLKEDLLKKFEYIDGIVFCAATSISVLESQKLYQKLLQDPKTFENLLNVNLISIYKTIYILEPILKNNSSLVFISSIGAHKAFPKNTGYQVSKAGLEAMARSISYDLSSRKIRANSIVLGYFKTGMTKDSFDDPTLRNERSNKTILGRWGEPNEITGTVKLLLSDESSYITGSNIVIDGGWLTKGL